MMKIENFLALYVEESKKNFEELKFLIKQSEIFPHENKILNEILRILEILKGTSRLLQFSKTEELLSKIQILFKTTQDNNFDITKKDLKLLSKVILFLEENLLNIQKNNKETDDFSSILNLFLPNFLNETDEDENEPEDSSSSSINELSINVKFSKLNSILENFDKLIMKQKVLKTQINDLCKTVSTKNQTLIRDSKESLEFLEKLTFSIQEQIISLRMLPLENIFEELKNDFENKKSQLKQSAVLTISDSNILLDRQILLELPKILSIIIENSLIHGFKKEENSETKNQNEKKISITSFENSSRIFIKIEDNGNGIDYSNLRKKAILLHPEIKDEINKIEKTELIQFLFEKKFSTSKSSLFTVRKKMDLIKGKISVFSEKNKGTTFELSLPSSLATQDGLFIRQGQSSYLILAHYVKEILQIPKNAVIEMNKGRVLNAHGELIPLYDFDSIQGSIKKETNFQNEINILILEYLNKKIAVTVDEFLHYQTVVIKKIPPVLKKIAGLEGCVFDENYKIIPVLNIPFCIKKLDSISSYQEKEIEVYKRAKINSILVVDDSATTRNIEKLILETENYSVQTAKDGIEALEKLKTNHFDLVVSDIKMPRMDGFVLLHNIRHTNEIKDIPVIIVSSVYEKETEEKAKLLGAQGFIVKSNFERENLIQKARELLNE